jgi:crossover junction endodeoxyribonuclease RuvC
VTEVTSRRAVRGDPRAERRAGRPATSEQSDAPGGLREGDGARAYAAEQVYEGTSESEVRRVRVLGVDPGLTRCGLGVVEGRPGRATLVAVGVVRTPADAELGARLVELERHVEAWLDLHQPDAVAVERVFAQHNVRTVMGTAQAGAVAIVAAARRGIPVALHTPSEVKAAVTGSGRADKAQVGLMVTRILRLTELPKPADAADALALAICHSWRAPALARLV